MQGDASDLLYKERGEIFASIDEDKGVNVETLRALLVNICNLAIKTHSPLYVDVKPQNIWKSVEAHFANVDPTKILATKYHAQMIFNLFSNKLESIHTIPNLTNLHRRILGEEAVLELIDNLCKLA
jgi:hypothetical protein